MTLEYVEYGRSDLDVWLYDMGDSMQRTWLCDRHAEMWNRLRFHGVSVYPVAEPVHTIFDGDPEECSFCVGEEAGL